MPYPACDIPSPPPRFTTQYPLRYPRPDAPRPFPTIYWLTDRALDHALADLERRGTIRQLEAALRADAALLERFRADHARYRDQRWAMLTPGDRAVVQAAPSLRRAFQGGIAGTAGFDRVKCLHAHAAHHLADPRGNTIARLLIERRHLPSL